MSDYPKKIHECFKRTLVFGSGKKVRPFSLCFASGYAYEAVCEGTSEASSEEQRENRELYGSFPNGSRCASCPFLKSGEYVSDALRILRTYGLLIFQEASGEGAERKKSVFVSSCLDGFFMPLLDRVRARCYLTFDEMDRKTVINKLHDMDFKEMFELVEKLNIFCKENDIK